MTGIRIATDNYAFYSLAIKMEMFQDSFVQAVLKSVRETVLYDITQQSSGHIGIYCSEIRRKKLAEEFSLAIYNDLLGKVAEKIPDSISGRGMNTRVSVVVGRFRFDFCIFRYERDSEHRFGVVEDATSLPEDEHLGRFVNLRISVVE